MNKLFPLVLGLMLPVFGALAADDFTDQAVEFCKSKGGSYSMGSMVEEGDKYCRQVTCKKTTASDGRLQIPEGEKGPEANVEATKRVCVAKSVVDGNFNSSGTGNSAGANSGSNSGTNSGSNSGSGSGATASGANSGSGSGTNVSGSSDGAIYCEEVEGEGRIVPGGLCYNECKSKRTGFLGLGGRKEGFERKECVECLLKYPGVYRVKREFLPKDSNGKVIGDTSVDLGRGVTVKTGVIICKDSTGKVVSVNGSACPPGMTIQVSGGAVSGSGNGSGTVIVSGGAVGGVAGGVGGNVQLPAYCNSTSRKDIEKCQEWMQQNRRFLCSSSGNPSYCMGGADIEISSRYDTSNCVNCQAGSRGKQSTLSGIAEIVGAIAPVASVGLGAYFGYKSNQAWAGAATAGFEQCRLDHNNYYQYLSANELPGLSPAQQAAMNCNGFGLGGYAGLGAGGLGGLYGAGYTPGFVGGMMGPYGGYNPYGMGGMVGGYVGGAIGGIGITGGMGMVGGYPGGMVGGAVAGGYVAGGYPGGMVGGGYPGGMAGGLVNGISIAGGFNGGGYPGGMVGGAVAGGYIGGYNGGFNGGFQGGYPGGMAGGMVNGISVAGGFNGGFQGGFQGGMAGGYMAGGYTPGGYAGGYMAGGFNGGFQGGYVSGGYAAGGFQGGYAGGGMAGGFDMAASQQAANYDRIMQQQGTSFQMGMGGMGGYGGGFGSAGYYPSNVGVSLGGSFGIGGGFGGGYGGW